MPSNSNQYTAQFLTIHPAIEKWEGGYVDHPDDPGSATNMGITLNTLSKWRGRAVSKAEVRALSNSEARQIFKVNYYDNVRGDDLPAPVALATYNSSIMSGVRRASTWMQIVLNSMGGNLNVDGEVGHLTIAAIKNFDAHAVAAAYFDQYEQFLHGLKNWKIFGKGWMNRVNDMRHIALSLRAEPTSCGGPIPLTLPALSNDIIAAQSPLFKVNLQSPTNENAAKYDGLTTVNGALGNLIGKLLDGRKTSLGIFGLLAIKILPILSPQLAILLAMTSIEGETIWNSLLSALLAWGLLGKTEKWVKGK